MIEYIERAKALEKAISTGLCDAQGNMYGAGDIVLADDIKAVPATDVAQVRHGRWINRCGPNGDLNITDTCSECGHTDTHSPTIEIPYCWFCGAKMDIK